MDEDAKGALRALMVAAAIALSEVTECPVLIVIQTPDGVTVGGSAQALNESEVIGILRASADALERREKASQN